MAKRYADLADALDELSLHYRLDERGRLARDHQLAASKLRVAESIPPDPSEMERVSHRVRDNIGEWRAFGQIETLESFREDRPYLSELTRISKVGPKTAKTFHDETGATTIDDVRALDDNDQLEEISGIGPKTATTIRRSIAQLDE